MSSHLLSPEPLAASGRSAEKLNLSLPNLQSKMKSDPEGYQRELDLLYSQFNSSLELFKQQAALSFSSISGIGADPTVAKDLGDRAMFLSHVAPFYPNKLADFPEKLAELLQSAARLPSGLRCHVTQALILLMNRQMVDIEHTLQLFMELQIHGDRNLKKLAFSHVIQTIRRMNQKHKDGVKNGKLQKILFELLKKDETIAKRSLVTLCELHRRKVWFDSRTADAICNACFHESPRIMIAAISFLLDYEKILDDDDDDSDASSSEDEATPKAVSLSKESIYKYEKKPRKGNMSSIFIDNDAPSSEDEAAPKAVSLCGESIYKANHKGTIRSKKKKQAKLQRAVRSMKRQQRLSSRDSGSNYYSPLNHLKDAQGFAEKLFSKLQACNERFEVKMMMLKVIARTIGLHRLILLNFYPYLQKYVQPHQRDITNLLAAAVQACHDMIPPDAVEPLFKQIVNQFVHDRSRTEAIAVGLNVIREICLRMPLLMTEELLQDLVLYKKSHEKAISAAARSLIALFREVCPSLLIKKDRGRPANPKAKPKAYGEVTIASDVPDLELLQEDDEDGDEDNDESTFSDADDDVSVGTINDEENSLCSDDSGSEDDELEEDNDTAEDDNDVSGTDEDESLGVDDDDDDDDGEEEEEKEDDFEGEATDSGSVDKSKARKRKVSDFEGELSAADTSLRALKKLAVAKIGNVSSDSNDGILSNEDFQRIKELKAKKEAKTVLTQHGLLRKSPGFKISSSDQLSAKPVDPSKLEAHVRKKMSKEERLALVRAGREDRGKFQARAAMKQNKTGGLSNRQKEHKKQMPLSAKRAKVAKSRQDKRIKQQRAGKQFRGKKAWK